MKIRIESLSPFERSLHKVSTRKRNNNDKLIKESVQNLYASARR